MIRCDFATTTKAVVGLVPGDEEMIRPMCKDGHRSGVDCFSKHVVQRLGIDLH